MKKDLVGAREKIDKIDKEISALFLERMQTVKDVALYKKENNLHVLHPAREQEVLVNVTKGMDDDMTEYAKLLYNTMFDVSRAYQDKCVMGEDKFLSMIADAVQNRQSKFPKHATVACQGVQGSNSMTACQKIFSVPDIMYMNSFDAVFKAVDSGLCQYGVLPLENNLHGSVTEVYDLMKKHNFQIVRSAKVRIHHHLLAKNGTSMEDVKEIYSHPQAIGQCSEFLQTCKNVKVIPYENTATSAEMVANSSENNLAAISGKECVQLYNLNVLNDDIQNSYNNFTRFICISKNPEIYTGANRISMMFTLPHHPGSLYSIISKMSAAAVNISKLESRPIPGMDFEFMFYIDFDGDITDENVQKLLAQIKHTADKFTYLGSYCEV